MKVKIQVILFFVGTMLAILLIQSSSLFAKGRECYCFDSSDADYICAEYCTMGGSYCEFPALQSISGECSGESCIQKWKIYCGDGSTAYYWQQNENCWWCWLI